MSSLSPRSSESEEGMTLRTLSDVVDDLGVGWCQARLVLLAGAIYNIGGEQVFLVSSLPAAIALELGLEPYQRAALGSVIFLGMLFGNLSCFLNDSLGRRVPLLLAMSGMLVFAGMSAFAGGFWSILVMWALLGLAYGVGVPTWNALCVETTPSDWRFGANNISMAIFCLGSLRAAAIVYIYAPDLVSVGPHWPTVMLCACASNAVLLALAVFPGFVESPRFLVNWRRLAEARQQLEAMRRQNGRPEVSLEFSTEGDDKAAPRLSASLQTVFGRAMWRVTLAVGLTTFLLNFMTFGQYYSLPQVLGSVDLGMSPALSMVVATCFEGAGYAFGFALEMCMGRKALTLTYLVGAGACTMLFICGLETLKPAIAAAGLPKGADEMMLPAGAEQGVAMVHAGLNGSRLFVSVGWCAAYTYAGEVFPTLARAAGSGVCIACGRLGSLSAPWVYEFLHMRTGTYLWYFVLTGVLCAVNGVSVLLVLHETKGTPIDEDVTAPLVACHPPVGAAAPDL